jgi:hypothetical protein
MNIIYLRDFKGRFLMNTGVLKLLSGGVLKIECRFQTQLLYYGVSCYNAIFHCNNISVLNMIEKTRNF